MPVRARPTSPHLQIYRWQIGNTLSILHRLTGIALAFGLLALCYWLMSLAGGVVAYAWPCGLFASPPGVTVLVGWTFAFLYHLLNGVRHLFWDAGMGFERATAACQRLVRRARRARCDAWLVGVIWRSRVMSLRSPLGRVLGMGSAKDGTAHWWAQRVTAVALVPLTLWFVVSLLTLPALDYDTVRTWLSMPLNGFLAVLLVAVTAYHSYLGTT